MGSASRSKRGRGALSGMVLAVALVAAACSGGSGTGAPASGGGGASEDSAQVQEAKRIVAQLEQPVQWKDPGPPIQVGDKLKGKTVYFVANGLNFEFVQNLLAGLKEAAALFGMEVVAVDGAGQVAKAASLIEQGVARKVDVIIDEGFPSTQLAAPLKAVKAAGIPVIEIGSGDPQLPPPEAQAIGVSAWATYCYGCAGRQMADFAFAQSGTDVNAVVYNVPEISVAQNEVQGFLEELKRLCPQCKAKVVDAPLAQWSTDLPSLTSSSLQSDPKVNWLVPLFDSMIAQIKPSVLRVNAQDRVKIVSYNATGPAMGDLAKGELVAADIGSPQHWLGWAMMDQAVRLLTGGQPVADENVPNRIFSSSNINSVDLKAKEDTWYGNVDFRAEYKKLWGLA